MLKGFKYRLLPNTEQSILINKTIGCARFVYNHLLSGATDYYAINKKTHIDEVISLKIDNIWLNEVDSLALANAKLNLNTAFSNFFKSCKGKRKGKKARYPKRKTRHKSKLSYKTNNVNDNIRVNDNSIRLPKLGDVKFNCHRAIKGNIKSCVITQLRSGKYEISILCEYNNEITIINNKNLAELNVIGIDMSFHDLAVMSNGEKANHPKYYRKSEEKLAKLGRQLSRKNKGSNNRTKARCKLNMLYEHTANQRKDYLHKLSRNIVDEYDVIVIEDINMQNMAQSLKLGKSVGDMGFGMLKVFLEYKAKDADKFVYKVDKWFPSSKLCSDCGYKNVNLKLSDREWVCPECGVIHDRDVNAAINLRNYFINIIQNTVGMTGIHACGDVTTTLREILEQVTSLKQEALGFSQG